MSGADNSNRADGGPTKDGAEGGKKKGPEAKPGEGIRSLKTSAAFRALNFELYAKPNKTVMGIGIAGIVLALGYLTYINYSYDRNKYYHALNEDDTKTMRPKTSRWES